MWVLERISWQSVGRRSLDRNGDPYFSLKVKHRYALARAHHSGTQHKNR